MKRKYAPFVVRRDVDGWRLEMRRPNRIAGWFPTQAEAIDYAYKNWPWWP